MTAPRVSDRVHYLSHGTPVRADGSQAFTAECRAAIVTEVTPLTEEAAAQAEVEQWDEDQRRTVGLCVLNPTGQFFQRGIFLDPNRRTGGTWHPADHE